MRLRITQLFHKAAAAVSGLFPATALSLDGTDATILTLDGTDATVFVLE